MDRFICKGKEYNVKSLEITETYQMQLEKSGTFEQLRTLLEDEPYDFQILDSLGAGLEFSTEQYKLIELSESDAAFNVSYGPRSTLTQIDSVQSQLDYMAIMSDVEGV